MIEIDEQACIGCGDCVEDCPALNIALEDGSAQVQGPCFLCGHCVAICPQAAVVNPYSQEPVRDYDPATFDLSVENVVNAIKFRRSVRHFTDDPVTDEWLRIALIEAAGHAPTAVNRQQNRFFVVRNQLDEFKELIWDGIEEELAACSDTTGDFLTRLGVPRETLQRFHDQRLGLGRFVGCAADYVFRNAPCVIAIDSADPLDGALAAAAIEAVAVASGYGVLYNGYLRRLIDNLDATDAFLDRDPGKELAACLLVGRPAMRYRRTAPRRRPSIILR